jgi:hypothetical protein
VSQKLEGFKTILGGLGLEMDFHMGFGARSQQGDNQVQNNINKGCNYIWGMR